MTAQPDYPSLTQESFDAWLKYLLPDAHELGFQKVGFLTTLWDAVVKANRVEKPILLWAMNGHPMACT
jgi:hypothetical protein